MSLDPVVIRVTPVPVTLPVPVTARLPPVVVMEAKPKNPNPDAMPMPAVTHSPPAVVRKRKVVFRLAGSGSTPLTYRCKFDQQPAVACGARVTISRLTVGSHRLKVRSIDQTGRLSPKMITRKFKVLGKR